MNKESLKVLLNKIENENKELIKTVYELYIDEWNYRYTARYHMDIWYNFDTEEFVIKQDDGSIPMYIPEDEWCICTNIKPWEFWENFDYKFYFDISINEDEEEYDKYKNYESFMEKLSDEQLEEIIDNFDLYEEIKDNILVGLEELEEELEDSLENVLFEMPEDVIASYETDEEDKDNE